MLIAPKDTGGGARAVGVAPVTELTPRVIQGEAILPELISVCEGAKAPRDHASHEKVRVVLEMSYDVDEDIVRAPVDGAMRIAVEGAGKRGRYYLGVSQVFVDEPTHRIFEICHLLLVCIATGSSR